MKTTKRSMLASGLCLLLSVALLMGATFAWFTDSVTNTGNTIQAGNLDVGFQYRGLTSSDAYQDVPTKEGEMGKLFVTEDWEPGRSQGLDLKVSNNGSLALKWQLYFTNVTCTGADIADVLDVYVGAADAQSVEEMTMVGTLSQVAANSGYVDGGELTAQNGKEFSVVLKMQEGAGNDYQGATVTFDVELRATQATVETDGFGNSNYDAAADGAPDQDWGNTISGSVTVNKPDEGDAVLNISGATVTVPAEAIDGDSVTLKIAPATTPEGVTVAGKGARTYAITLEGVKEDNTTPISVSMYVGTGLENVQVYQGTQEISATYDSASGYLQFSAVSFDLLTVTYDVPCAAASTLSREMGATS